MLSTAVTLLMLAAGSHAQTPAAAAELTALLKEFLGGAARNDAAVHERFWADDLVYTGSTGRRVGKADIMRDVRAAPPTKPGDPSTSYAAEDVRIQQYGDAAVVAFRLVATTARGATTEVSRYFNSGTFVRRGGRWQVVSWQATRVPRAEEEARQEVVAAEAAFRQAALNADLKTLESLLDESFVWTRPAGGHLTRRQLLDHLGAGQQYPKPGAVAVAVSVYGDAAVVRGVMSQPTAPPGAAPAANANSPFTMTFVNRGGWKAVALHTSAQ
jgi:ketosteroid isomerase-like protein